MPTDERAADVTRGLDRVRERIATACDQVGRAAADVQLIVITKTYPASDVRVLADLGVSDVGENRDQEAAPKAEELADLDLRWHFVGQLQSNKAKSVASYAGTVHSCDRASLIKALAKAADPQHPLRCLIQVSLDDDISRGGASIEKVPELGDLIAGHDSLHLGGVMAVAPLGADPDEAFATLAQVSVRLRSVHPDASHISAGMSGDLESAIRQGATLLRVGGAVLGERPPLGYRRNAGRE